MLRKIFVSYLYIRRLIELALAQTTITFTVHVGSPDVAVVFEDTIVDVEQFAAVRELTDGVLCRLVGKLIALSEVVHRTTDD